MVSERRFRADLYYRLNVFPIVLPPLRERALDIPALVRHFVRIYGERMNKIVDDIPEHVMESLCAYDWPGNIRELQNFVERAVLMSEGGSFSPPLLEPRRAITPTVETLADMERVHIMETLQKTNWVIGGRAGAAMRLGIPRTTLISRMRKLGISRKPFHSAAPWRISQPGVPDEPSPAFTPIAGGAYSA
jgi:formate hydrogenlyase transcriptional activator